MGVEEESGRYYIAFTVSNMMAEYTEWYKVEKDIVLDFPSNFEKVKEIVIDCPSRKRDKDLFLKPGSRRGLPVIRQYF